MSVLEEVLTQGTPTITGLRPKAEGVWIADEGVVYLTEEHVAFLEREAPRTRKRRARILTHRQDEGVHEMLIFFCFDSLNVMHAHEKVESMLVLKGAMQVLFKDRPPIMLNAGQFLRIPPLVEHKPIPITDCVVMETAEK